MSQRKFAVFDIDGTLVRWQLYHAVVDRLAKKGHLGIDAEEQIHGQRMVWKRREHPDAFEDYEQFLVKFYEKALNDLKPSVFDRIAREVADEYKEQVYTYTRDLVYQFKSEGYWLLAISGSHDELVGIIAKQHGFDDWVGSYYHRGVGRFIGTKDVASHDKKASLRQFVEKHDLSMTDSYAIGDSRSDIPMMEIVEHPIAFNPTRELFDHARGQKWPIVVERKNVVYKLKHSDGSYILA
ncbi:MAG TPA: HAD family phosphatase [Candidatus Saccharimonadales bacterium]|nr:HAD family phosphatase [Candidatus Saccharimonadales bacterium]